MAYCPNCGKELKPEDRFCSRCGARAGVREDREDREERRAAEPPVSERKGTGEKQRSNCVIITGMICVTAVVLVIALLIFFSRSGKSEPSSSLLTTSSEASVGSTISEASVGSTSSEASVESASVEGEGTKEVPPAEPSSVSGTAGTGVSIPGTAENPPLKDWPDRDTLPFSTEAFYMELPGSWADHYCLEKQGNYYDFYNIENQEAGAGGFLFSVGFYEEYGLWEELPGYEFLAGKDGVYYVAEFPTDVQFDAENEAIYREMQEDIGGILDTFTLR